MPTRQLLMLNFVLIFALSLSAAWSSSPKQENSIVPMTQIAKDLLVAIKARDNDRLKSFLRGSYNFQESSQRWIDTNNFIYKSREKEKNSNEVFRSILEIVEVGEIEYMVTMVNESTYTIYYIPKKYFGETKSNEFFLKEEFMKKYFACEFNKSIEGWKMNTFCFAETEGPFPQNSD